MNCFISIPNLRPSFIEYMENQKLKSCHEHRMSNSNSYDHPKGLNHNTSFVFWAKTLQTQIETSLELENIININRGIFFPSMACICSEPLSERSYNHCCEHHTVKITLKMWRHLRGLSLHISAFHF